MHRQAISNAGRAFALALGVLIGASATYAVGPGFTFQGQLEQSGSLQNGTCDFQFSLYNATTAGTKLGATQTVSTSSRASAAARIADPNRSRSSHVI